VAGCRSIFGCGYYSYGCLAARHDNLDRPHHQDNAPCPIDQSDQCFTAKRSIAKLRHNPAHQIECMIQSKYCVITHPTTETTTATTAASFPRHPLDDSHPYRQVCALTTLTTTTTTTTTTTPLDYIALLGILPSGSKNNPALYRNPPEASPTSLRDTDITHGPTSLLGL
jgi:hypothetical protein